MAFHAAGRPLPSDMATIPPSACCGAGMKRPRSNHVSTSSGGQANTLEHRAALSEHLLHVYKVAMDSHTVAAGQTSLSESSAADLQSAVSNLVDPIVRSAVLDMKCFTHETLFPTEDEDASHQSKRPLREIFVRKVSCLAASLMTGTDQIWQHMAAIPTAARVNSFSATEDKHATAHPGSLQNPHHIASNQTSAQRDSPREYCDAIGQGLISMEKELRDTVAALASFIEQYNNLSGPSAGSCVSPSSVCTVIGTALYTYFAQGVDFSTLLARLAQLYELYKAQSEQQKDSAEQCSWEPPSVFKRKTDKYWVRPESLMEVKVALCRHIPVLVYSGKGNRHEHEADSCRERHPLAHGRTRLQGAQSVVNSIYLDNATSMEAYARRVWREDGATLLRLRWYGSFAENLPHLQHSAVYLERKIHCEGGPSSKDRVEVPENLQHCILSSTPLPVISPAPWMTTLGTKSLTRLVDIKQHIDTHEQRPVIKTTYIRTALQKQGSSAARVTIDENFSMSGISIAHLNCVAVPPLSDHQQPPAFASHGELSVQFTLPILEVKLECASNSGTLLEQTFLKNAVEELCQDHHLVKVPGYSKFQHSVGLLMPGTSPTPKWFVEADDGTAARPPTFQEMLLRQQQKQQRDECPSLQAKGMSGTADYSAVDIPCPSVLQLRADIAEQTQLRTARQGARGLRRPRVPLLQHLFPIVRTTPRRPIKRDAAASFTGNHRTHQASGRASLKRKPEPRTFWSNERTFLSWISISVLLLFTGLALMDGSTSGGSPISNPGATSASSVTAEAETSSLSHQIPGVLIAPVGLLFMIYALVQHRVRTAKILSAEATRYDDQIGPIVLVALLLLASATAFSLSLRTILLQ